MSDVQPSPTSESSPERPASSGARPRQSNPWRLIILLLVLAIAAAAVVYDYRVARPGFAAAQEKLNQIMRGEIQDPSGDGTFEPDEIHQVLEREPSTTTQVNNGSVEVFTWISGLPFRQYKLYVVFEGTNPQLFNDFSINEEPASDQMPVPINVPVDKMTKEEEENFKPLKPFAVGAGQSGKRKPGSRPKAPAEDEKPPADEGRTSEPDEKADTEPDQDMPADPAKEAAPEKASTQPDKPAADPAKPKDTADPAARKEEPPAKQDTPPAKSDAPPVKKETSPAKEDTPPVKKEAPPAKEDTPPKQPDAPSESPDDPAKKPAEADGK